VSLLRNGKKRQREGIASIGSLGGTGGGRSAWPVSFAGEDGYEGALEVGGDDGE